MKRDLYSDVTARILQSMKAGVMPWDRQWQSAGSGRFGTQAYAAEELVAELGAAFLNAEFGFDNEAQNASYLDGWIKLLESDSRAIFTAASKASKAAEYLRSLALAEPMALAA